MWKDVVYIQMLKALYDKIGGKTMRKQRKKIICAMAVFLVLCLISSVSASLIQTSFGKVSVEDVRIETETGTLSMLIYTPTTATSENPVPCVVTSHGIYNSREMQDAALIELSRRGIVVVSIDMYGHGHSDSVLLTDAIDYVKTDAGYLAFDENGEAYFTEDLTDTNIKSWNSMGMVDAVNYVYDNLDYVSKDQIGVMGHSYGAQNANYAAQYNYYQSIYGNGINKVAGTLLVANTPSFDYSEYSLVDAGLIIGQYDEFFQASTSEAAPTAADVIRFVAQNFLYAHTGDAEYASYTKYYNFGDYVDTVNLVSGEEHFYVAWMPSETHPVNVFSTETTGYVIDFWQHVFEGDMSDLSASTQHWFLKECMNGIGLVGFFGFLICCVLLIAELMKKKVQSAEDCLEIPTLPAPKTAPDKVLYLISFAIAAAVPGLTFYRFMAAGETFVPSSVTWPQVIPNQVAWWAFLNGLISLAITIVFWLISKKNSGVKLSDYGVKIERPVSVKIIGALVIPVFAIALSYAIVWLSDSVFHTDYRFFTLAVKTFRPQVLYCTATLLIFFLVWSFANNIAVNANFREGMPEWAGYVLAIVGNVIGVIVLALTYYVPLHVNGVSDTAQSMYPIQLYAFFVLLPLAAVNARLCYKKTGNVYLGTVLNAILLCMISCANTYTLF